MVLSEARFERNSREFCDLAASSSGLSHVPSHPGGSCLAKDGQDKVGGALVCETSFSVISKGLSSDACKSKQEESRHDGGLRDLSQTFRWCVLVGVLCAGVGLVCWACAFYVRSHRTDHVFLCASWQHDAGWPSICRLGTWRPTRSPPELPGGLLDYHLQDNFNHAWEPRVCRRSSTSSIASVETENKNSATLTQSSSRLEEARSKPWRLPLPFVKLMAMEGPSPTPTWECLRPRSWSVFQVTFDPASCSLCSRQMWSHHERVSTPYFVIGASLQSSCDCSEHLWNA